MEFLDSSLQVGGRKIAIVDDCEDNTAILVLFLKRIGYQDVVSFKNPLEVLPYCDLHQFFPDLFLLDVMMSSLSGIDLAKRIKSLDHLKHSAVMFITSKEKDETLEQCFDAGAIDFLPKPICEVELRCRLARVFEMQDIQRRLLIQNEELRKCSLTDGLTGVYNRRYLDIRLSEECAKSDRYSYELSFLMLDLDNFKQINDEYGHPIGDRVLKQLANILLEAVRSTDMVARYGGEEFSVILTGTPLDHALDTAERIRKTVEESDFLPEVNGKRLTISIGVASNLICAAGPQTLVSAADHALYQAKAQGKNKVLAFSGDTNNA